MRDVRAVEDFQELDVGAVWEIRVRLQQAGRIMPRQVRADFRQGRVAPRARRFRPN